MRNSASHTLIWKVGPRTCKSMPGELLLMRVKSGVLTGRSRAALPQIAPAAIRLPVLRAQRDDLLAARIRDEQTPRVVTPIRHSPNGLG